jgi:hypothetical protein
MPRAPGRDIAELFGYSPDDLSQSASLAFERGMCPFSKQPCSKRDHSSGVVYGVCSVTNGSRADENNDVIVCPQRLYADDYRVLKLVADEIWSNDYEQLVVGGTLDDLKSRALAVSNSVVAFGYRSGKEVSAGSMSMDWVLQRYSSDRRRLQASEFVGIEVQSIDITGNYRDPWAAYKRLKNGHHVPSIPNSEHGLNWANVHKRLIPQIIRKGNLYSRVPRARGFFFLTPDLVFQRFEGVLGTVAPANAPSRDTLSIITFELRGRTTPGSVRALAVKRRLHFRLSDVAAAFVSHVADEGPSELDRSLMSIL